MSDRAFVRITIGAILWLGMMAILFATLERTQYHKYYPLTGFVRLWSFVISYSAIWLPLLILIPYFLFFKPEWRETFSPVLFKIPLALGCVIGFLSLLAPKIIPPILAKSYTKIDERELKFNADMDNIKKYQDVMSLLYYTSNDYDESLRSAALTKIKASKNLENELIAILETGSPYGVFDFLMENKVKHPDRFTEPIVKSFSRMTADMHEGIVNPYKGGAFDVGPLLSVLEGQFLESLEIFRPHVIKLQEVMETPPAQSRVYDDVAQINEVLLAYREEIKNWLARH